MQHQNMDPQRPPVGRPLGETPIAIVGLGALYPRAGDLREFWGNVVDAADCIQDVPESHWKISDYYDPDPSAPDKTYSKRGGFVPTVPFNPMEFGLPPNILEVTDVLQLLSLVVAKQTLADAGATGSDWYDPSRTGVILGITGANSLTQPLATRLQTPVLKEVVRSCGLSEKDAEEISAKFAAAFAPWEENSFPGMLGNVVAGRIANRFDLGGTNCTVDAACASSLAAVHMAVAELISGRADMMITGGCDAENTILMYMCFSKTPALSKSGTIRPFDEASDGTLIGEGTGMIALKRLADAERDGDRIYAVLRGVGTSSDGRFKSIYAPRKEGQEVALRRAYADAGFGPESVGLVECHGTGTSVGDLTELSSLREVFSSATDEKQYCAVGSVKSQIGHTKAAAGAAAMIKVALALHQKVLPPTINVERPREAADFPNSPFYINTKTRPWILDPARPHRRAALSSFGFGGTNFHLVLEEHDPAGADLTVLHRAARVHLWHGADVGALLSIVDANPEGLAQDTAVPAGHARLAVVATGAEELDELRGKAVQLLRAKPDAESLELPGAYYRRRAAGGGKIAGLFAGQGSQYVGMGGMTALGVPAARAELDAMSLAFGAAGSLARAVFPPPAFDDATSAAQEEALRATEYAQPAIGALSAGQFRFLRSLGLRIDGALGHSFGELTALWAAGAVDDEQFRALAVARGRAMAAVPQAGADRGAMASVRATPAALGGLLAANPDVVVCNLNSPEQTVVGGGTDAVHAFVDAARKAGIEAKPLPVAAAFHTRYVAHAVDAFRAAVSGVDIRQPDVPVYANTEGSDYGADVEHNRGVLVDQLARPVGFAPRLSQLYADGYRIFVEFGPRSVLSGLVRQTLGDRDDVVVLAADAGPTGDGDRSLKQLVARLVVLGLPLTAPNRCTADVPVVPETKGMRVPLNGVNYVPEERRRAYREALDNGYQVAQPSPAAIAPAAAPVPVAAPAPVPAPPAPAPPVSVPAPVQPAAVPPGQVTVGAAAGAHLAMHRDYLDSQLRVAERLSNVLQQHSEHGGPSDNVVAGISAVTEHSMAIGQSHIHASDVLRSFAHLEAGTPPQAAYSPPVNVHNGHTAPPMPPPEITMSQPFVPQLTEHPPANGNGHNGHSNGHHVNGHGTQLLTQAAPVIAPPAPPPVEVPAPAPVPVPAAPAPSGTDVASVRTALLEIVAEKTGYPADMIDPSMDVEADLGIDSIKRVEIMGALRERFPNGISASPEQLGELRTLEDIVVLVAGQDAPPAPAAAAPVSTPPATGGTDVATVRAALLEIVAEKTGYPADMIDPSMDVEADLGIDSIKRVEIMGALRERFPNGISASPEQLGELRTLEDIVVLVSGAASTAGGAGKEVADPKADGASGIARMQARLLTLPAVDERVGAYADAPVALVAADGTALADAVAGELRANGWTVHTGRDVPDGVGRLDLVLDLATASGWTEAVGALTGSLTLAGRTQRLLETAAEHHRAAFVTVTRTDGALGLSGVDDVRAVLGGLPGLVKTLAIEAPTLFCRSVDLSEELTDEQAVRLLLAELHDADAGLTQVGIAGDGTRYTVGLRQDGSVDGVLPGGQTVGEPGPGDLLVVTGGARGVTAACVIGLARRYRTGLLLLGRTALADEPAWATGVPAERLRAAIATELKAGGGKPTPREVERIYRELVAQREILHTLESVRDAGATAEYLAVDVTDYAATATALAGHRDRITGVVHGAGVLADQHVVDKQAADVERVLATKLDGLRSVLGSVDEQRLRHVLLFSSVAGFFGNRGQSDYAMANEALNRIAAGLRRRLPATRVTSVNWGAWAGGMVTPELERMFAERGVPLIPLALGVERFVEQFTEARSADVVCVVGPDTPLATREAATLPAGGLVVRRDLRSLGGDPVVADHAIAGVPVLPATAAVGAILGAATRAVPGRSVVGLRRFAILKGLVLDGTQPEWLEIALAPADGTTAVTLREPGGRARYRAEVLDTLPAAATMSGLPAIDDDSGDEVYRTGALFHGPALRGIRRVLADDGERLVLACRLADTPLGGGAYRTEGYSPVLADLLLQAALVRVHRSTGSCSLPAAIGAVEVHGALPDEAPFLIVVDDVRSADSLVRCTVTACSPDGTVLLRFRDVEVVPSAALGARFAG